VSFKDGSITKYSENLDSLLSFSPTKIGSINNLEAWHGFKVFCFYQQFQEYTIFDRYLSRESRYQISASSLDFVNIATISSDEDLWLIEQNGLRLIKYSTSIRQPVIEIPLEFVIDPVKHQLTYIKEYQNLVFIVDSASGIYVFDNLGNYLTKIAVQGIDRCTFLADNIIFWGEKLLTIQNLYDGNKKQIDLPNNEPLIGILVSSNDLFLIGPSSITKVTGDFL
jgi:hypothetical protein